MSAAVFIRPRRQFCLPERLVIFGFFAMGAGAACFGLLSLPEPHSLRSFYGVLLLSLLLFSASGVGWIVLPFLSLILGYYEQNAVLSFCASVSAHRALDPSPLLFTAILVPSAFLAASHGLCVSAALHAALHRASPTARAVYQKELTRTVFFVLLGLAAVFYFT